MAAQATQILSRLRLVNRAKSCGIELGVWIEAGRPLD